MSDKTPPQREETPDSPDLSTSISAPPETPTLELDKTVIAQHGLLTLAILKTPDINELTADPIYEEMKTQIDAAKQGEVFTTADAFAKRYMLERIIPALPENLQEKARAVVTTVNFGTITPEERPQFIQLAKIHQQISRTMILHMITAESADRGLNPLEIAELKAGIEMANATDDIYSKWESMQHDIANPAERQSKGFTSKWHIVKRVGEGFVETAYQNIYRQEYDQIIKALEDLLKEMESIGGCLEYYSIDPQVFSTKLDYYKKLAMAYLEMDQNELPRIWLEVDKAFVKQGGNLRAVHPIEDGYGANETGMIPEQSLRYFVPSPANKMVAAKKAFILERFPELLTDNPKAQQCLSYIQKVDAGIALYVVRSGLELVFKIAGHNIPNEKEARDVGVHIYIDPNTMNERLEEAKGLFKGFFAPEYHGLLDSMSNDAALAEIATHELGHNIGGYKFAKGNAEKEIPPVENHQGMEEWKATATTYVAQTLDPDSWTDEALRGNFMSFLCQAMRYSQRRNERSQLPYYNADRFFMKLAQETGLINQDENGKFSLDLSREKLLAYAEAIKNKWMELQDIYAAEDTLKLDVFIKSNMTSSPFMDAVDKFTQPEN